MFYCMSKKWTKGHNVQNWFVALDDLFLVGAVLLFFFKFSISFCWCLIVSCSTNIVFCICFTIEPRVYTQSCSPCCLRLILAQPQPWHSTFYSGQFDLWDCKSVRFRLSSQSLHSISDSGQMSACLARSFWGTVTWHLVHCTGRQGQEWFSCCSSSRRAFCFLQCLHLTRASGHTSKCFMPSSNEWSSWPHYCGHSARLPTQTSWWWIYMYSLKIIVFLW